MSCGNVKQEVQARAGSGLHADKETRGHDRGRGLVGGRSVGRHGEKEETFASSGELASVRLGMTIEEQWPAMKLVGFSFYYAWIWVSYNSNVLVLPSMGHDLPPDTISIAYLVSTFALGVSLGLLSLIRRPAWRLTESGGCVIAAAILVGLATIGIYLSSGMGTDANPLLVASAAVTGVGTSVIVLRFGVIYSKVPPREAVMYTAVSFVLAAMVYFVAVGLPNPVGLVLTALFPLMAVAATLTNPECVEKSEQALADAPPRVRSFFVRLLVAIAVFSTVVGVARGFAMPHSSLTSLNSDGALIVFGNALVAMALFVVVGLLRRQFDVSRLYYPIIIAVAAGILVTPLVGGTGFGGQFVTVAYNCFVLVIWCLLAYVAFSSRLSPVLVFGCGRCASALGATLGWLGGLEIVRTSGEGNLSLEVISVAMVFALLIVSMLVLNDRLIGEALRSGQGSGRMRAENGEVPARACGLDDGAGCASIAAGSPDGMDGRDTRPFDEGEDVQLAEGRRPGRYQLRCNAMAERFGLSPRERDVFDLLVRGRSIEYIAQALTISFNTAKSHIRHIYVKVDVHSRQELLEVLDQECLDDSL